MRIAVLSLSMLVAGFCPGLAMALSGTPLSPFVAVSLTRDDNFLRLDERESPNTRREESYLTTSAGVNVSVEQGRQRLRLLLSRSAVRYDNFQSLDYDGEDYRGTLGWQLGNRLFGNLGVSRSVTQTSFSTFDFVNFSFRLLNNTVTRENYQASGNWQFHPRWRVGVSNYGTDATNSTLQQSIQDNNEVGTELTLTHETPKGSSVGVGVVRREVDFPNRQVFANSRIDNSFDQTEFNLNSALPLTGKLLTQLRVGYVSRKHASVSERDFSGLSFRVLANYMMTGKSSTTVSLYRELSGADVDNANTRLVDGVQLSVNWQAYAKVGVRASFVYENHDYTNDPGQVFGRPKREEDNYSGSVSLSYNPVSYLTFDLGVQAGVRDSSILNGSFEYASTVASVRGDF